MKHCIKNFIIIVLSITILASCSQNPNVEKGEMILRELCDKYYYKIVELQKSDIGKLYKINEHDSTGKMTAMISESDGNALEVLLLLDFENVSLENNHNRFKLHYSFITDFLNSFTSGGYTEVFIDDFLSNDSYDQSLSKQDERIIEKHLDDDEVSVSYTVLTNNGYPAKEYNVGDTVNESLAINIIYNN